MKTPLQVITVRDQTNPDTDIYVDTIRLAFEGESVGSNSKTSYLADSIDLSIRVLDLDHPPKLEHDIKRLLSGAQYTILIVIDNSEYSKKKAKDKYRSLEDESEILAFKDSVKKSNRFQIETVIEINLPDPVADGDIQNANQTDRDGIEPSLQPVALALNTLNCARNLLQRKIYRRNSPKNRRLRLFLSHAKIDGVPIALSLLGLMRRLRNYSQSQSPGDDYFYDVEHIQHGDKWRDVLEKSAKNSVLIALRTDEYEKRYWCRQEFLWAESYRMPILVVDLRSGQYYDSARLPFDVAPLVKVHDGNLVRVLLLSMAYDLRRLSYQVQLNNLSDNNDYIVLPHKPSVYSIKGAIAWFNKSSNIVGRSRIVYPNPPLPDDYLDSIKPLLPQHCELVRIDQLMGRL